MRGHEQEKIGWPKEIMVVRHIIPLARERGRKLRMFRAPIDKDAR